MNFLVSRKERNGLLRTGRTWWKTLHPSISRELVEGAWYRWSTQQSCGACFDTCLMKRSFCRRMAYEPAESTSELFGGNSNWRGPVWFPLNYLIIESLQKFHYFFGDDFKVECPTGSGQMMNLWDVSAELSRRLSRLFLLNDEGYRPVFGDSAKFQTDPSWKDHILFFVYVQGDTGAGLGASHQTGWTALVAKLLQQSGE